MSINLHQNLLESVEIIYAREPRVANHRAGHEAGLQALNASCLEGEDYREPISLEWMKMLLDFKPGYESIIAYCLPFEFIVVGKDTNPNDAFNANQKIRSFRMTARLIGEGRVAVKFNKQNEYLQLGSCSVQTRGRRCLIQ